MKRIIAAVILALLLAGCSGTPPGETEQTDSSEIAAVSEAAEAAAETTGAETSGTVSEIGETTVFETEKPLEEKKADTEHPVVTPVNEIYDICPMKVIFAEEQPAQVMIRPESISEDIYNIADLNVGFFSAEYPVISAVDGSEIDENICTKINAAIKEYIDERFEDERQKMYRMGTDEDGNMADMFLFWLNDLERREHRDISYRIDCNSGNILSVYFEEYSYYMAIPGSSKSPYAMIFDLRTGDRIDIDNIISDRGGFDSLLDETSEAYINLFAKESKDKVFENYVIEKTFTYKNGSLGYYFVTPVAVLEWDSSEIYGIYMPLDDVLPYFSDDGRDLFSGHVLAEKVPVNLIEYKNKKWLDIVGDIPYFSNKGMSVFSSDTLTEGDYEFISLFGYADTIDFYKYTEIDLRRIAELKNIKRLTFMMCDIDDISPLIGSGINYICIPTENNIPEEQIKEFEGLGGIVEIGW